MPRHFQAAAFGLDSAPGLLIEWLVQTNRALLSN